MFIPNKIEIFTFNGICKLEDLNAIPYSTGQKIYRDLFDCTQIFSLEKSI